MSVDFRESKELKGGDAEASRDLERSQIIADIVSTKDNVGSVQESGIQEIGSNRPIQIRNREFEPPLWADASLRPAIIAPR